MEVETGRLRVVAPQAEALAEAVADPSAEDASSPGAYIRQQRLHRGMSLEQLAVVTKIPRASLELLEEDRYDELPGPVFAKGFLRCCARSLGVGTERVMELLFEQERAALHARRKDRPRTGSLRSVVPMMPTRVPPVRSAGRSAGRSSGRSIRGASASGASVAKRLAAHLPSASFLLWILVAVFVALVVMMAFNLMGAPPAAGQS